MKTLNKFFFLLVCGIFALGFNACSEEDGPDVNMIYDFSPIEFIFTVSGDNGEDLLNPATPGNYSELPIAVTFDNKTYIKDAAPASRYYMPTMRGLQTLKLGNGQYSLYFGELDGEDDYDEENIVIDWKDGTTDIFTFSHKTTWKKHKPICNSSFKLNGEKLEIEQHGHVAYIHFKKKALQE